MKIVGQKARILEQRIRYDVIDALKHHDIGFHSNWHGLRPQVAEYLAPLGWEEGAAEFARREYPGVLDVRRLFGVNPVTYGQPGPNWAPQVFPVLRQWGIPTYVSGFGYVGLDCQPFWYGGVLCTSHMYGNRLNGQAQNHFMGLNFELGKPGELEKHKEVFSRSHVQLSGTSGLISIINHPCTLVLEDWFTTYLKPRDLTEAGYQHFEEFVRWVLSHDNVRPICASDLPNLYPDRAFNRHFSREEIKRVVAGLREEVSFQRLDDCALSAAEAFSMLTRCLRAFCESGQLPDGMICIPTYNPTSQPCSVVSEVAVSWEEFCRANAEVADYINWKRKLPACVRIEGASVAPADFLAALARVLASLYDGKAPPEQVQIVPTSRCFEHYVDEEAAHSGWNSVMMLPGFTAPGLVELAKLGAWTLKPAILQARG
jgi:hypothetical protein